MKVLIWGAGALGQVLLDTLRRIGGFEDIAWLADDQPPGPGPGGLRIWGDRSGLDRAKAEGWSLAIAMGAPVHRWHALLLARDAGLSLPVLVDPHALVSPSADLAPGCLVLPGAIINSGARIGHGCLMHNQSLISHHCELGDAVSVYPGARLLGNVQVGSGVTIGAAATVLPGVKIGAWAAIGLGAGVLSDIDERALAGGNPARQLQLLPEADTARWLPLMHKGPQASQAGSDGTSSGSEGPSS